MGGIALVCGFIGLNKKIAVILRPATKPDEGSIINLCKIYCLVDSSFRLGSEFRMTD